uniref:CCHC-type domain-containing protein n=1 Tax=Schizaphis graminum TaxID=13262 RepID=A0A2S2PIS2_SCHGA
MTSEGEVNTEATKNTEQVNNPPTKRVIDIGALSEDELLGKIRGYINCMCSFAQANRNVHRELKETLANSSIIIAQYVKVVNHGRAKEAAAKATCDSAANQQKATSVVNSSSRGTQTEQRPPGLLPTTKKHPKTKVTEALPGSHITKVASSRSALEDSVPLPDHSRFQIPAAIERLHQMVKTQGEVIAKLVEKMDKLPEKPQQQRQRKSSPRQEEQLEQHQQQPQTDTSRKTKKRERSEPTSQTNTGSTQDPPHSEDNVKWETVKNKSMQKKKKKERKRLKPRTRTDVFIVKAGIMKSSEMLKKIKNGEEVQSLGDSISAVSKTRSVHLRVVLNRKTTDTEELLKAITRAIGDKTICNKLTDSTRIEIRNVDEEATDEEIVQAILKSTELLTSATILHTRKVGRGTKIVTVSVPTSTAHTLASTRLRVGYVNCRVRRKIEVKKCFKCQGYGNTRDQCTYTDPEQPLLEMWN